MSDLTEAADQFRADLLAGEQQASARIVRQYLQTYAALRTSFDALAKQIDAARAAGTDVKPGWLYRQDRYQSLMAQITDEISGFAQYVNTETLHQQTDAITAGQSQALQLTLLALGAAPFSAQTAIQSSWNKLPTAAIENLTGMLAPGTTLADALATFAPDTAAAASDALVRGVAQGKGLDAIARDFQAALGGTLDSAMRTTRTAVLNAKRQAQLQNYQANPEIVSGWIWHAVLDERTCPTCVALHGTFHPSTEEFMKSHWQCRCAPMPRTKSWADLGFPNIPDTRPTIETGVDWFNRQDEKTQLALVGPAKFEAIRSGKMTFQQVVGLHTDPIFGQQYVERSLSSIVGKDEARGYLLTAVKNGRAKPAFGQPLPTDATRQLPLAKADNQPVTVQRPDAKPGFTLPPG